MGYLWYFTHQQMLWTSSKHKNYQKNSESFLKLKTKKTLFLEFVNHSEKSFSYQDELKSKTSVYLLCGCFVRHCVTRWKKLKSSKTRKSLMQSLLQLGSLNVQNLFNIFDKCWWMENLEAFFRKCSILDSLETVNFLRKNSKTPNWLTKPITYWEFEHRDLKKV